LICNPVSVVVFPIKLTITARLLKDMPLQFLEALRKLILTEDMVKGRRKPERI
jgi:hypothetical protein